MHGDSVHVLLIAENAADARMLREILASAKGTWHELEHVDQLPAALARLAQGGIDVVLIDLGLSGGPGLSSLEQLRHQALTVPIVALTSLDDEAFGARAREAGAQDYLAKGHLEASLLVRTLRYAMEQQRLHMELQKRTWELLSSEARVRGLLDLNADAIVVVDRQGAIQYATPEAGAVYGRPAHELLGQSCGFPLEAGTARELAFTRPSDRRTPAVVQVRVVESEREGQPFYLASLRDVTNVARLRDQLRDPAIVDEHTGLYNRRGFLTLAQQQVKLADRTKRDFLLFLIGIKNLKWISEIYSRQEGGQALITTAQVLQHAFRQSDIVARIARDQFAVVAVAAQPESADLLRLRILEELSAIEADSDQRYKVLLSVGVASYDPSAPCSIDELLAKARSSMQA